MFLGLSEGDVSSVKKSLKKTKSSPKKRPSQRKAPATTKCKAEPYPNLSQGLLNEPKVMELWIEDVDEQLEVYYSELRNRRIGQIAGRFDNCSRLWFQGHTAEVCEWAAPRL